MVVFVSAFILSDSIRRPLKEFFSHFDTLAKSGIEILLFLDERLKSTPEEIAIQQYPNVKIVEYITLDTSWYPPDISSIILPANRNQPKDTLQYITIQLMKMKFMWDAAAKYTSSEYLAWIDFSIFHMIKDIPFSYKRLNEIANIKLIATHLISPSPYSGSNPSNLFDNPIWYFAGCFFIGHRLLFQNAYETQLSLIKEHLPKITWEVNYWFMMRDKFKIYYGNHDDTILTLPISEFKENHLKNEQENLLE